MVDPASSPSQSETNHGFAVSSSLAMLGHSRQRRLLTAGVLLVAVTFVAIIVSLSLYLTSRPSKLSRPGKHEKQPFCCPEDAREMAVVVNTSISPCRDFFGRVCNGVIELKLWKRETQQAELERIMITGVFPEGSTEGDAGRFLAAYYKSCVETVPHREAFVSGLAEALTRATRELLVKSNSRNAFLYATMVSLKYKLPPTFTVHYGTNGSYLTLSFLLRCRDEGIHADIVNASIDALANVANVSVTPKELHQLTANACSATAAVAVRGLTKWYRFTSTDADEFDRTVWNVTDVQFALSSVGYLFDNKTSILVSGVQEIRALYGLYATENRHLLGSKAALLLSRSLQDGVWQFYATYNGSWIGAFEVCSRSVHHIDNVWSKFVAELKDDPSKFDAMRTVFMRVKDAVYHEVSSSPLFEAEDAENVTQFFNNVSLETAWTDAGLLAVAVPWPARSFTENLLRARAYNFEVHRVRVRVIGGNRGMNRLYYVGHSHIFLSAAMCDFVRSGPSSDIPNMAILGLLVAESVWSMILSYKKWTPSTLSSIERLAKCYVDNYFGTDENSSLALKSMPRALAMRSVLNAFDRPDWDTVRSAWSLLSMSHGEIFYSLVAYYRCPLKAKPDLMRVSNVPFAFAGDLAKVFHCESDSPMAKPQRCITGEGSRA